MTEAPHHQNQQAYVLSLLFLRQAKNRDLQPNPSPNRISSVLLIYFVIFNGSWFSIALRPRKPKGSLGRTAQDGHLDSHTAPEL